MNFNSFDETRTLDNMLFEMAMYDVNKGLLPLIDNKDAYQKLYIEATKRFNYFKKQIQMGEYTFESIRDNVLARNGPYYQKKLADDEIIDNLINPPKDKPAWIMTEEQSQEAITAMEEMIRILRKKAIGDSNSLDDNQGATN